MQNKQIMNIFDFIEWVNTPEIYDWAIKSCEDAFKKIFKEEQ